MAEKKLPSVFTYPKLKMESSDLYNGIIHEYSRALVTSRLIRIYTVCHSVIDFLTETTICNNECVQIQRWKSPCQNIRNERVDGFEVYFGIFIYQLYQCSSGKSFLMINLSVSSLMMEDK